MATHEDEIEAWRRARYRRLTAPDGWLTLIGKYPLAAGNSDVVIERGGGADVPLHVAFDGTTARLTLENGQVLQVGSEAARHDGLLLELLRRDAQTFLRVKDERARARTEFTGIPHYPVDAKWRIVAPLSPFPEERTVVLDYEEGASVSYRAAGESKFAIDGREERLTLLYDTSPGRLFVLFKDATHRDTTYGAGRFLYTPLPSDGKVVLDFNMAFNPPCALTPWASCPLVPRDNWLVSRVEAGEKRPETA